MRPIRSTTPIVAPIFTAHAGTGITTDVPCWNQYLPCSATNGWSYAYSYAENQANEDLPCDWYKSAPALDDPTVSSEMGAKADRFPWCSPEAEESAAQRYFNMRNLTSSDGSTINLAIHCGTQYPGDRYLAPAGVLQPSLSISPALGNKGTLSSFTTHWNLTVTTTTEQCPTFAASFANAFAYTAQIEIIVTIVLIYLFKKKGLIEDVAGALDIGAGGIVPAEKMRELAKRGASGPQSTTTTSSL